jgi:hypothetical protein
VLIARCTVQILQLKLQLQIANHELDRFRERKSILAHESKTID